MPHGAWLGYARPETFVSGVAGRLGLLVLAAIVPAAGAQDPENCLFCHQYRGLSRLEADSGKVHLYFVDPEYTHARLGPHARLACTDCHRRDEVSIIPHQPVSPVDCTRQCHLSDPGGLERRFSHGSVAVTLQDSVHPPGMLAGLDFTGGPLLAAGQAVCLYCHDEPLFRDPSGAIGVVRELGGRVFDRCNTCHAETVPVDIDYYLRHIGSRLQPARPTLEIAQVCAVCHSDARVRSEYALPDAVASWVRSFHGKAALLGDQHTASCLSCHVAAGANAHHMLSREDPRAPVHPAHVADSCRSLACHPGADQQLAASAVHLDLPTARGTIEFLLAAAFIAFTVLTFGPSALIVLLDLTQVLVGRHHHARAHLQRLTLAVLAHPEGRRRLVRFTPSQRVQHWVLAVLFTLLALTGFPMKFADRGWAEELVGWFGGLGNARLIHHWAGIALIVGLIVHAGYVVATILQRRRHTPPRQRPGLVGWITSLPMWVGPADARDALHLLGYLLFLRREPPTFGRFSIKEKFEYFGVFWGTVLLGVTGLLLWGEQISTRYISGRWLNLALIAHTYEAFLAVIHVGILHIINVIFAPHVFPLSRATLTGQTPVPELVESHSELVQAVARDLDITVPREPEPEEYHD